MREEGFHARGLAAQGADEGLLFQLSALLLQTEVEYFVAQLAFAAAEFIHTEFGDFLGLHGVRRRGGG